MLRECNKKKSSKLKTNNKKANYPDPIPFSCFLIYSHAKDKKKIKSNKSKK